MTRFVWLFAVFSVVVQAGNVRDNGGNCVGVKSCRPRCVTFRVDRETQDCGSRTGIFQVQSDLNPWDIKRFKSVNCKTSDTCINKLCDQDLSGDLTVRIGEEGHSGSSYFTSISLAEDVDKFTYCSIYPCPKDECSVPEQMGFGLLFDFIPGSVVSDEPVDALLRLEMYLKAAFVGPPIRYNEQNRFGPLHVEWMDDPTGCRKGIFSPFAPVAPLSDPTILTNTSTLAQNLYCTGEDYDTLPLPQTAPPTPPTSASSASPTASPAPNAKPALSPIQLNQLDTLGILYRSTAMSSTESSSRHNWFNDLDYCNYTGVTCNDLGYVKYLDLTDLRLAGSLPSEIANLQHTQVLILVDNEIRGTLPTEMAQLRDLTNIIVGLNGFEGPIPTELASLVHLRRLMLQNNELTGTIPEELCNLHGMTTFDISGNVGMHGEIPSCFGNLSLEVLKVDDVGLVGQVPSGLCGARPMNGLNPNVYGCRAIACPAGEFEPIHGREDGNQTECQQCPVSSNVIGSTTCKVVDGNTIETLAPTATLTTAPAATMMPTTAPSEIPTSLPSSAPSDMSPTVHTTPSPEPSQEPSSMPWSLPTVEPVTNAPTSAQSTAVTPLPTPPPTKAANQIVHVTALFRSVSSAMTEVDDIHTFERITKEFITNTVQGVEVVEVLSQLLRLANQGEPTLLIHNDRFLETSESLFVEMQIVGDTTDGKFEESVVTALKDSAGYQNALSQELEMFETVATEVVEPEPQIESRQVNWKLLGSAVGLSVLAMGTVFMVRRRRKKHDEFMDHTRYQPETRATIPRPEDHVYNPYEISLSEESSGGWVSEESEDDYVNQENGVAEYSQNNELCLMSQASETRV